MEKKLEQLLRDAYRAGFYKARESAKVDYFGPCHRSFFDNHPVRKQFKALMKEARESE